MVQNFNDLQKGLPSPVNCLGSAASVSSNEGTVPATTTVPALPFPATEPRLEANDPFTTLPVRGKDERDPRALLKDRSSLAVEPLGEITHKRSVRCLHLAS